MLCPSQHASNTISARSRCLQHQHQHHPSTRRQPHVRCCRAQQQSQPDSTSTSTAQLSGGGVLQLGQLVQPSDLLTAWQEDILPGCLSTWQALSEQLDGQQVDCEQLLLQLDALLGTCQQVLLLCGLLKDRHSSQQWRAAAAAVFVEGRSLEQEVCSDAQLQQGLLACLQQLVGAEGEEEGTTAPVGSLCFLARSLLRHMQLESLTPCSMAAAPAGSQQQRTADAQVLTLQEQQAILSGLLAEQRVLVNKLQALLFDPAAAPVVELDADSTQVVLEPLQDLGLQQALQGNLRELAAAAGGGSGSSTAELRLDLQTVTQLLRLHPDAAVRQEVYSAGLLCMLDGLLSVWGQLAEVRRKIGRSHGCDSYAHFVLQHSLLGSPDAAGGFCQQLISALQPAAVKSLQQQQQQQQQPDAIISGCDLPRLVYQEWQAQLSTDEQLQLQDYLQLPAVLRGLSHVLQLLLGTTLTQRQPHPGEVWGDSVLVLELTDSAAAPVPSSSSSSGDTDSKPPVLLGTIYLDLSAGYPAQLLLYGARFTPHLARSSSSSSSWQAGMQSSAPAVALGLQSGGVLAGGYDQVALGLWELCHEFGHAVNFLLSSNSSSNSSDGVTTRTPEQHLYHLHASWLPVELLELPSTLFEVLALDPTALQLLCRHQHTGEPLPEALAARLAGFMQAAHYGPATHQSVVLAMLFDLEAASISSRQLGAHAAHHMWRCVVSEEASAMPQVELTLQQVAAVPRLLATAGQGYGYAVAWSLAQLLQPLLVQHIQQQSGAAGHEHRDASRHWRRLFEAGAQLADARVLAGTLSGVEPSLAHMLQKHGWSAVLEASLQAVAKGRT